MTHVGASGEETSSVTRRAAKRPLDKVSADWEMFLTSYIPAHSTFYLLSYTFVAGYRNQVVTFLKELIAPSCAPLTYCIFSSKLIRLHTKS